MPDLEIFSLSFQDIVAMIGVKSVRMTCCQGVYTAITKLVLYVEYFSELASDVCDTGVWSTLLTCCYSRVRTYSIV